MGKGLGKLIKPVGKLLKNSVKAVGKGVKHVFKAAGKGVKHAFKAVGKGVKHVFRGIGKGVKSAAKAVGRGAKSVWRGIKSKHFICLRELVKLIMSMHVLKTSEYFNNDTKSLLCNNTVRINFGSLQYVYLDVGVIFYLRILAYDINSFKRNVHI